MLSAVLAASVVTLACEAYDITSGQRSSSPTTWTVTVDYSKGYAYGIGAPLYPSPTGVNGIEVSPGQIALPRHRTSAERTVEQMVISRESGAVAAQVHDLRKELTDTFARNDQYGRSRYAGLCKPTKLVPIPATKF